MPATVFCKTPDLSTAVHRVGLTDHYHENCEILIETSGTITNTVNHKSSTLRPGDVSFINIGALHSLTDMSEDHEHRDIYISPEQLKRVCLSIFDSDFYDHLIFNDDPINIHLSPEEFEAVKSRLLDLGTAGSLVQSETDREINRRCILAVIVQILGVYYEWLNSEKAASPGWMVEFLRKVQTPEVFSKSVEEIISLSGYSHTHFCALFKQNFHKSFKVYINELRLSYARAMLISTDSSVLDISLTVGYSSLSHFIQCFKKGVGVTPQKYRAMNNK